MARAGLTAASPSRLARSAPPLRGFGLDRLSPARRRLAKRSRFEVSTSAARAAAMLESSGQQAITPQMVQTFARTARERIRIDGGGYRRDHLRALAQRVEVADCEVRIIGSKSNLLQALTAAAGVKPATAGVRSSEVAEGASALL